MNRCDEVGNEYEVTLLIPHVYRITAETADEAKEQAAQRFAYAVKADVMGFPEAMVVKQVDSPARAG